MLKQRVITALVLSAIFFCSIIFSACVFIFLLRSDDRFGGRVGVGEFIGL